MKTKDRKLKKIRIMIIIFAVLIIFIVINRRLQIKNIGTQVRTSYTSTETLDLENSEKQRKNEEEKVEVNKKNSIEDTSVSQTDNSILTTYKGYPVIAKLEIPSIDLITDVLSDYSEENLKISVTKFYKGKPNQVGNFCIVGHNYITSNMFHNLNKLEVNEKIYLTDKLYGKKEYYIYKKEIVNPKDVSCLSQETDGNMELTLITCTADSKKRIIIKAREL